MKEIEADKIPNVQHPRNNKKLYGHKTAKSLFLDCYNKEKLHHAWLIHGPKGVGKATFAWKIVKLLQNNYKNFDELENQKGLTFTSRRIEALSEQSILLCRRKFDYSKNKLNKEISIEDIRKINYFFSLSNTESKYRIVIIDNINELSISGSNALLKILEEPPKNSLFLIICENKRSVIPTIISRCRILELNYLKLNEFKQAMLSISKDKFSDEKLNLLYLMSRGSIGQAIEYNNLNGLDIFNKLLKILLENNEINIQKIFELLTMKHKFETIYDFHKFLINLFLKTISTVSVCLASEKFNTLIENNEKLNNFLYQKTDDTYFKYAFIYSIVQKDFNNALRLNLNLENTLISIIIKINKINNIFKSD